MTIDPEIACRDLVRLWRDGDHDAVFDHLEPDHPGLTAIFLVQGINDGALTMQDANAIANGLIDRRVAALKHQEGVATGDRIPLLATDRAKLGLADDVKWLRRCELRCDRDLPTFFKLPGQAWGRTQQGDKVSFELFLLAHGLSITFAELPQ